MKFYCKFKKIIAGILIGFGIGILMVLFLPLTGWLLLFSIGLIACRNKIFQIMEVIIMTIVVKKVPKFLRGFVKLIFGIKDT